MRIFILAILTTSFLSAQTAQYPGSLATDANLKVAVNGVNTLLTGNMTTLTTTLSVSSCAGIVANVLITIDQEIMPVSGCTGTVLVVGSRGFDGTTTATHTSGTIINAYVDAWHTNALRVEIEAIESSLGVNLSNLVLATAIINGAHGGTGVNNGSATLTLGGSVRFSGAFSPTFVIPSSSTWTFPAAGTLIGSADMGTVTNAMLAGSISPSNITGTAVTQADTGTVTNTMLAGSISNSKLATPVTGQWCGTANACSATPTSPKVVSGLSAALNGASPSIATITGISPPFTATGDYSCTANEEGTGASTDVLVTHNVSSSSFTITGPNSATATVHWICVGF